MRKTEKKKAENFIELLGRAHEEIKLLLQAGKTNTAAALLAQCQDGAVKLGNMIEKLEGNECTAILFLQQYCESAFHMYEIIQKKQMGSVDEAYKHLQNSLFKIENSINHEIKARTEVVFLPYKASMWDSLESVWKAAAAASDCDVYVIPIPYYDRNPDGSFRTEHYEGSLYPDYVPITRYDTFNFESHRPDIIVIHNPYDDCNYVTSVHPFFYAKNLKKYTDQLVYIPYFILEESENDNQQSSDRISHFCTVPGVFHADTVIVQSKHIKQLYIEALTNAAGAETRKYWEEKIWGLGSPKVDKILGTERKDISIPDQWLNMIQKPDGSRKRVIFYNTSVVALLQYNEHMLEKIKDVFHFFRENSRNLVLLWRPHPLIQSTIEAMRPQLWEKYNKLVQQYLKENWGIYDDTADLERAVILCDAYYGDGGSVVQLCRNAEKPIIIQDIYATNTFSIPVTEAIIEVNDEYWFIPYYENSLYRMNKFTYIIQKAADLEERNSEGLFIGIVRYEDKLYLIPKTAEKIAVYHLIHQDIHYLDFRNNIKADAVNSSFLDYQIIGDALYLIPCKYQDIVWVHMNHEFIDTFPVPKENRENRICTGNSAVLEMNIYIPFQEEKCLLKFNYASHSFEKVFPCRESIEYTHVFESEGRLWLIPYHAPDAVRLWDIHHDRYETICPLPEEVGFFSKGIKFDGDIFLLSASGKMNASIHTDKKEIEAWSISPDLEEWMTEGWHARLRHMGFFHTSDKLYTICGLTGEWFQNLNGTWEPTVLKARYKDDTALKLDHKFLHFSSPATHVKRCNCGNKIFKMIRKNE